MLLDIRVDDQEQTHRLLKDGEVMGCISTQEQPMQGCRIEYIGRMNYHMMAAPDLRPDGFRMDLLSRKSAVPQPLSSIERMICITNSSTKPLGKCLPPSRPTMCHPLRNLPEFIALGLAYGMLPDQQSTPLVRTGQMVDLSPDCHVPVKLYWHCWNLKSDLLEKLTQHLKSQSKNTAGKIESYTETFTPITSPVWVP